MNVVCLCHTKHYSISLAAVCDTTLFICIKNVSVHSRCFGMWVPTMQTGRYLRSQGRSKWEQLIFRSLCRLLLYSICRSDKYLTSMNVFCVVMQGYVGLLISDVSVVRTIFILECRVFTIGIIGSWEWRRDFPLKHPVSITLIFSVIKQKTWVLNI